MTGAAGQDNVFVDAVLHAAWGVCVFHTSIYGGLDRHQHLLDLFAILFKELIEEIIPNIIFLVGCGDVLVVVIQHDKVRIIPRKTVIHPPGTVNVDSD